WSYAMKRVYDATGFYLALRALDSTTQADQMGSTCYHCRLSPASDPALRWVSAAARSAIHLFQLLPLERSRSTAEFYRFRELYAYPWGSCILERARTQSVDCGLVDRDPVAVGVGVSAVGARSDARAVDLPHDLLLAVCALRGGGWCDLELCVQAPRWLG